jgi:multiple sugar transport system substrate-binding protein
MKCNLRSPSFMLCSLLLVLALLLGACTAAPTGTTAPAAAGDTAASSAPAKVRVMTFFAYDNPEVEEAVVAAFEAAHPEVDVELELTSYNDIFTKYQTQVAGGTAPDVISMNFENLRSFATKGAVEPLTDYIARDSFDTSIYYDNTLDMHTVDGVVYGLPATFSDNVLYYNMDLFDAAGVAYPDGSWDWNKLQEVGSQFVKDADGDGNIDTYGYGPAWYPMYLFLWGSNILTPDNSQCALTTPEALEAMNAYAGLFAEGGISANAAAQATQGDYDRFVSGNLAMYVAGPWAVKPFNDAIADFTWDIALHPAGSTEGTFLYSNSYAISGGAKNKDAAWEFLKFASGPEGVKIRQEGQFEIAAVKSVAESTFVESMAGQSPASPQVFMEATANGKRLPDHARFQEILDSIQPELELALNGDKSMEEAMAAACTAIDGILQEQ